MKNMKKKNAIIIAVVAVVLVLGIGFALFSETVNINGTVKAEGNMDVEFFEVGAITEKVGYTQQSTMINGQSVSDIAVISQDKNTLTLNINKLEYPGAKVTFPVTIKNVGTIPILFESIEVTEPKQTKEEAAANTILDSTKKLSLSYTITKEGIQLLEKDTQTLTITAEWLNTAEDETQSSLSLDPIDIKLNYKQVSENN